MSHPVLNERHVLVIGQRLAPVAQEAMPAARLEVAGAERLDLPDTLHGALELLLIDVDAVDPAVLTGVLNALSQRPTPPAVLLAGSHLPTALVKAVMRLSRSDVLEAPFTSVDLSRAAAVLLADAKAPAGAPHQAHCWTVMGSVGGCGATTIAVEIATELARRAGADRRVALVDLNLCDGAASAYLGATANMLLAEASATPERIDQALLDAFSMRVGGGLDLLACPRDPKAFGKVSAMAVCRVLEVACQVYDHVVVDLPRHHQAWTLDVLAGCDEILVVSELTVPALLAARSLATEIEAELPDGAPPRIILNRLASRVFGPAPSLAEAEKALQRKADGGVTSDWEAAAASANLGGAISHHRPRSKIVRDIAVLVDRLTAPQAAQRGRAA
ncbi:AAA family ATPase [Caulobacter sp. KR2-114]|uniref:AAA family ATPase n=1 Tax=Caulobacter sp. KR2-114 TaxID=3400912 RepID=UPI003C07C5FE